MDGNGPHLRKATTNAANLSPLPLRLEEPAVLVLRHPELFNGVVLSAPAIEPSPSRAKPWLVAVSGALSAVVPKLPIAGHFGSRVSRNPQVQEQYFGDPQRPPAPLRIAAAASSATAHGAERSIAAP